MKKFLRILFVILVLLGSFAAAVHPLSLYDTIRGMQGAAAGRIGTAIYEGNGLYVMMWPARGQYGFAVINQSGDLVDDLAKMVNGNGTTVWRMSDLVRWMESNGYQRIDPRSLPVAISQVLLSQFMTAVAAGSRSLITPLLIPAGAMDNFYFEEFKS